MMWKVNCFRHLLASLKSTSNAPSQLISVGDGSHEAIACEVAAHDAEIPYRNVILLDTPSPKQITAQLNLLAQELQGVISHSGCNVDFNAAVVSGGSIEFQPVIKDKDEVTQQSVLPTFSPSDHGRSTVQAVPTVS